MTTYATHEENCVDAQNPNNRFLVNIAGRYHGEFACSDDQLTPLTVTQ